MPSSVSSADTESKSDNDFMPLAWSTELEDCIIALEWAADGRLFAAMPADGSAVVFDPQGGVLGLLDAHAGGNCTLSWHPTRPMLATYGQDAILRLYGPPFDQPARHVIPLSGGWAERCAWNSDGSLLAALCGKRLIIVDAVHGRVVQELATGGSLADVVWNPARYDELATAGHDGLRLWQVGEAAPVSHFAAAGACQKLSWSPDGRWLAIAGLGTSGYIFDTQRMKPLHIQGYHSKLKALAWDQESHFLASAGGENIFLWPCAGEEGPLGATPVQLMGHLDKIEVLDFAATQPVLLSAGRDGLLLIWMPRCSTHAAIILHRPAAITCARFSPHEAELAYATASGEVGLCAAVLGGDEVC